VLALIGSALFAVSPGRDRRMFSSMA
jgi:hypothetical protein